MPDNLWHSAADQPVLFLKAQQSREIPILPLWSTVCFLSDWNNQITPKTVNRCLLLSLLFKTEKFSLHLPQCSELRTEKCISVGLVRSVSWCVAMSLSCVMQWKTGGQEVYKAAWAGCLKKTTSVWKVPLTTLTHSLLKYVLENIAMCMCYRRCACVWE